jgi:cytoskeletal protein RodZ
MVYKLLLLLQKTIFLVIMEEIGNKIRAEREKLNLSIKQVADKTKIREQFIQAIEAGNLHFLPPVYAKSFINSYLKYLKINDPEINKAIKDELKLQSQSPELSNLTEVDDVIVNPQELFIIKRKKLFSDVNVVNYLVIFLVAVGAVTIFYFAFFSGDSRQQANPAPTQQKTTIYYDTVSRASQDNTTTQQSQTNVYSPDSIYLDILALEPSWIRIVPNGRTPEELTMATNQKKRWIASKYFTLSVGNAGALTIWRNAKQLPTLGKKGYPVKNIRITKDSVFNFVPLQNEVPKQTVIPTEKTNQNVTLKKSSSRKRNQNKTPQLPILLSPSPIQQHENVIKEKKPVFEPIKKTENN